MFDLGNFLIGVQLNANGALQGLDKLKTGLNSVKSNAEQMQKALNATGQGLSTNAFVNQQKSLEKLNSIKEKMVNINNRMAESNKKIAQSQSYIKNLVDTINNDIINVDPSDYEYLDREVARHSEKIIENKKATQELNKESKNLGQQYNNVSNEIKKADKAVKDHTQSIHEQASAYRTLSLYAVAAFVGIVSVIKQASDAFSKYNAAMSGLQALTLGTGNSFNEARSFINEYTNDGLIPATEAATALKNLLARGYTNTQAIDILERLKDSAAYNRQAALSMGQAIAGATEGLKNENSILVDNAGVTKNVSKMWEEYADKIGKTKNELTLQEKIQAEYNGIMKETSYFQGNATKYAQEYAGQMSKTSAKVRELKQNFGEALAPTLQLVNELFYKIIGGISDFIKENKVLVAAIITVITIIAGLVAALTVGKATIFTVKAALSVLGPAITGISIIIKTGLIPTLTALQVKLTTLLANPVVLVFTAIAAVLIAVAAAFIELNNEVKEHNKQLAEEKELLEQTNKLRKEGIPTSQITAYEAESEKMKNYLAEYDKYNKIIEENSKKIEPYQMATKAASQEEMKQINEWNNELKAALKERSKIIEEANAEGINLKTLEAVKLTKEKQKVEEEELKIAKALNTEESKVQLKSIATKQGTIKTTKDLINTYKTAKKGTDDWIDAEKQLSELFPEFSTLNGIKIDAIEDSIDATEKQNKAEWILFKDTIKRNKDLLESEHIKQEAIIKGTRYSMLAGKTLSEDETKSFQAALSNNKALMESLDQYNIWEKITSSDEIPGEKVTNRTADKTSNEKTAYEKAIELYEHRKNLGQLTLKDEVNVLNEIKKLHAKKTEEIIDIDERIYNAKTALSDSIIQGYEKEYTEHVKTSERWVKQQKGFNKLTEDQEEEAYKRMIAYKKDYIKKILADENVTTDKKIEIKERENDAIEDLEMDIFNLQTENMKKIVKSKEDYLDDYDSQLDRFINQQKLRNNITDDEEIANYKTQIKEHKKYLAEIETDTKLSEEEKIKIRKEELQKIEDIEDKIYTVKKEYIDKALDDYMQSLEDEIDASEKAALEKLKDEKEAIKKEYETIDEEKESADRAEKLAELRKREALYQNAATKDGLEELKKIKDDIKDLEDKEEKQRLENVKETELDALDKQIEDTETKYDTMRKNLETLRTDMENEAYTIAKNVGDSLTNVQQTIANKSIEIFRSTDASVKTLVKSIMDSIAQAENLKINLSSGNGPYITDLSSKTNKTSKTNSASAYSNILNTTLNDWIDEAYKKLNSSSSTFVYNDYGEKSFNNIKEVDDFGEDVFLAHAKARTTK